MKKPSAARIFKRILSYKSRGVVIFNGFCIAEGLQDGVCLKQLLFQFPLSDKTHRQNSCKLKMRQLWIKDMCTVSSMQGQQRQESSRQEEHTGNNSCGVRDNTSLLLLQRSTPKKGLTQQVKVQLLVTRSLTDAKLLQEESCRSQQQRVGPWQLQ